MAIPFNIFSIKMIDIFCLHYTTHLNLMRIKPTVLTYIKFLFI